jgi:hypothetical protein
LSSGYRVLVEASEAMLAKIVRDWRMVGGYFETGLCGRKVAANTLSDGEAKQIGLFVQVSWPEARFPGGKVSVVAAFQCLK